jgi:glycosyltransferase involved in cell wall biosynthesis
MPSLSIGLPIYNGENYAEAAIQSLLGQSYTDFELIIADNASTDGTEEICLKYAAQDNRIRYFRHEKNMGAAFNFNFTFAKATGDFFKWASHDDVLAPTYLERCLDVLERNPEVVLCHTLTNIIDDQGNFLEDSSYPLRLESEKSHARFRDLTVIRHDCFLVFGVVRRRVLEQTPLIGNYVGSDRVLLGEFALHGHFAEVPEILFSRRRHDDCSCELNEREERVAWFDPDKAGEITYPNWRILKECVASIRRVPQPARNEFMCHLQIPEQMWVRRGVLWSDLVEGLKMSMKRTEAGNRLFYFLKRHLKSN